MKFIFLVGDGMGDYPIDVLNKKTPLMAAKTPNMDFIATHGSIGLVETVPEGMPPGSDVANMTLMGFDPKIYHTGRGPIEAASLGIKASKEDIIFRCNLVTLTEERGRFFMADYSAEHISSEEAKILIEALNEGINDEKFKFFAGVSYRHILIWYKGKKEFETLPPHDVIEKDVTDYFFSLPEEIRSLMGKARFILKKHPINISRINRGLKPANSIWPWGQGKIPDMPKFEEKFGLKGAVISAVDLIKGIGILAGLKIINVPGATGYFDTNYKGKAEYALSALEKLDFVYVHVEAPDEAGHEGNLKAKIESIEAFDEFVVGTILRETKEKDIKILVTTDHYTPISVRTHVAMPVPFAIFYERKSNVSFRPFSEESAKTSGIFVKPGHHLIELFFKIASQKSCML